MEGIFSVQIAMPEGMGCIGEFRYEKFEVAPDLRTMEHRKDLLDKVLKAAKKQIADRRHDAEFHK